MATSVEISDTKESISKIPRSCIGIPINSRCVVTSSLRNSFIIAKGNTICGHKAKW